MDTTKPQKLQNTRIKTEQLYAEAAVGLGHVTDAEYDEYVDPSKMIGSLDSMKKIQIALMASLTLGLAPFLTPSSLEAISKFGTHSRPMETMDWVDILMHGTPWVLLIVFSIQHLKSQKQLKVSGAKQATSSNWFIKL